VSVVHETLMYSAAQIGQKTRSTAAMCAWPGYCTSLERDACAYEQSGRVMPTIQPSEPTMPLYVFGNEDQRSLVGNRQWTSVYQALWG